MNSAITSPELRPGEPHPAVRLAEVVCALIAAIAGPSWFWRFLPGGRAMWEGLQKMSRDFAALMHRLASAPPAMVTAPAPIVTRAPRRRSERTGEMRPRRAAGARPARSAAVTAPQPSRTPATRPPIAITSGVARAIARAAT